MYEGGMATERQVRFCRVRFRRDTAVMPIIITVIIIISIISMLSITSRSLGTRNTHAML